MGMWQKGKCPNCRDEEMKHKAKEITTDESRYLFLKHMASIVDFWEKQSTNPSLREKLEGVLFSVLSALDGCAAGLPGYLVIPNPSPEDKKYAIQEGFDYEPHPPQLDHDIGGGLHEQIHMYFKNRVPKPARLFDFGDFLEIRYNHDR